MSSLISQSWRDLRSGRLLVLIVALAMAVGSLGAVSMLGSRMKELLAREANSMLGADAVFSSSKPISPELIERAKKAGLSTAIVMELPTMAGKKDGEPRLTALKSAEANHPLRGRLTLRKCADCPEAPARGAPARGEAWADPALLEAIGAKVGEEIIIGDTPLKVSALIEQESDRSGALASFGSRVMISMEDLKASGLAQPISRVSYKLGLAGPEGAAVAFSKANPAPKGDKWMGASDAREETTQALSRAESFLSLASTLSALLACAALALGARRYARQSAPELALSRALGMSQSGARRRAAASLVASALVGALVGCAMAWSGQWLLTASLGDLVPKDLPQPGAGPLLEAVGLSFFLLLGFAGSPIYALSRIPPSAALRRDEAAWLGRGAPGLALCALSFMALLAFKSSDVKVGLIASLGFGAALLLMALVSWVFLSLCGSLAKMTRPGSAPRLALLGLSGRRRSNAALASGLAAGLFALALLGMVRGGLAESWRDAVPASAPDRFLMGLDAGSVKELPALLKSVGAESIGVYPIARARLISINGEPAEAERFNQEEQGRRALSREWSLSSSDGPPPDNEITEGAWSDQPGSISIEQGVAKSIGLKVGDKLVWESSGEQFDARVSSIRRVDWAKMRANFYGLMPSKDIEARATQAMANFKAPAERSQSAAAARAVFKAYPSSVMIDASQIAKQVRSIADKALLAVQSLFFFSLFCGALVLWSALLSARDERGREAAIARALGASDRLLNRAQTMELALLGALAGAIGAGAASAAGWAVATQALGLPWAPALWPFVSCALAGAILCAVSGRLALRGILRRASLSALRASDL